MRLEVNDPRPIFAGAKLMARNYGGRMQLTRVKDELRVLAHNAYVLVERTVPAGKFDGWDDGDSICFDLNQSAAEMVARVTKVSPWAAVEITRPDEGMTVGHLALATLDYVDVQIDVDIRIVDPITTHKWVDEGVEGDPIGEMLVTDSVLRDAAGAAKQVTPYHFAMVEWTMRNHGEGKPIELVCDEHQARVLFMPCRSRLGAGE